MISSAVWGLCLTGGAPKTFIMPRQQTAPRSSASIYIFRLIDQAVKISIFLINNEYGLK